jgi:hypothetical protein
VIVIPFLVLRNSKSSHATPFSCFYNWIRLTADVRNIGGGLPSYQELLTYMMMPHCWQNRCPFELCGVGRRICVLRPPSGRCLATETAVGIALFAVGAVSVVLCRLHLRTSWKPSFCVGFSVVLLDALLAFKIDFKSFRVTVYVPYSALNNVLPESALQ